MKGFVCNNRFGTRFAAFRFAVAVLVSLVFLTGCSDKGPQADERLVSAYVEIRVVEQTYGGESPAARLARRAVLEKYGYDRESFVAACDKVLEDEKMWVPFQRAVTERVDSLLGIPKPVKDQKKGKEKK